MKYPLLSFKTNVLQELAPIHKRLLRFIGPAPPLLLIRDMKLASNLNYIIYILFTIKST